MYNRNNHNTTDENKDYCIPDWRIRQDMPDINHLSYLWLLPRILLDHRWINDYRSGGGGGMARDRHLNQGWGHVCTQKLIRLAPNPMVGTPILTLWRVRIRHLRGCRDHFGGCQGWQSKCPRGSTSPVDIHRYAQLLSWRTTFGALQDS